MPLLFVTHGAVSGGVIRLTVFGVAAFLLLCFGTVARADSVRGEVPFSIHGVRLGDRLQDVTARFPQLRVSPLRTRDGVLLGVRAHTQQGYSDGGFFSVLFQPEDMGGGAWNVTLNTRRRTPGERLENVLARHVEQYGPYDLLCRVSYAGHAVYHIYWGGAPVDCSAPGMRPATAHLYLNLVLGTWTEEFLVLSAPMFGGMTPE